MFFGKKWDPTGLHVYITGGSNGLGLSMAVLMVKKGAHVSIVARNKERLNQALATLEGHRQNPEQKLNGYSFVLDSASESTKALEAACEPFEGQAPDAAIACAGASKPGFFVEMTEEELSNGMSTGYWVQAWTAWAVAKMMVRQSRTGKIVLVSSTLGFISFVGWASYAPGKHALRALGDTLQSEMMLYGIDVHTFFPPTMKTNGYLEEMKTKPKITREIEGNDPGITTDYGAEVIFNGMRNGHLHIVGDFITNLFRTSSRGAAPRNNTFLDTLLNILTWIAIPIWRIIIDGQVRKHREEHLQYLHDNGFFGDKESA